jgi:DNA (cytosine-5)-methyltransferase 1
MEGKGQLLSLFCGCGGLDLGFEQAGFSSTLAYDLRSDAVSSWNRNRGKKSANVGDVRILDLDSLDKKNGSIFRPRGVIGGPPCQGFSLANRNGHASDPRNQLVDIFFDLAIRIHHRSALDFIVMENVPAILGSRGGGLVAGLEQKLDSVGFSSSHTILDAVNFGVPQRRRRFFLVAFNKKRIEDSQWRPPVASNPQTTVRDAIFGLPEPTVFSRGSVPKNNAPHENHWCMTPRSQKFFDGTLKEGFNELRSFKTLSWDQPSYTASYGNREVHVHPNGKRRLSVFEAMRLQGFPDSFVINGTLSSQITQVSEAVPPPLAKAVAESVVTHLNTHITAVSPSAGSELPNEFSQAS